LKAIAIQSVADGYTDSEATDSGATMEIDSQALTTCEIAPDGKAISLGFVDSSGKPAAVRLPVEQVGALVMTLPTLIEKALRKRFGDDSLRYTYPLGSWTFEQSPDPQTSIVTLRTTDGFGVCFSLQRRQQDELGEAFSTDCDERPAFLTN
jgi:hypothetical protein